MDRQENKKIETCCICNKEILNGDAHNPSPLYNFKLKCCRICYTKMVIPEKVKLRKKFKKIRENNKKDV